MKLAYGDISWRSRSHHTTALHLDRLRSAAGRLAPAHLNSAVPDICTRSCLAVAAGWHGRWPVQRAQSDLAHKRWRAGNYGSRQRALQPWGSHRFRLWSPGVGSHLDLPRQPLGPDGCWHPGGGRVRCTQSALRLAVDTEEITRLLSRGSACNCK